MGRVSTCQKNCKTIDLRGAQVNKMEIHTSGPKGPQVPGLGLTHLPLVPYICVGELG